MPAPITASLLALAMTAADPRYLLEHEPVGRVEATMTYRFVYPDLVAKEWIVFAPKAPELPCQTKVTSAMTPAGETIRELSPFKRAVLLARVPVRVKAREKELGVTVKYDATLVARHLKPLTEGDKPPKVPPLLPAVEKECLAAQGLLDFKAKPFQKWLDAHELRTRKGEDAIDFARRTFLAIRKSHEYKYVPGEERSAARLCDRKGTDCGGLSVLFVAALRANGIPARVLVGRWATSAKEGEKIDDTAYYQWHVKAEFYAAGIGWVPVDMACGLLYDKTKEGLKYFGHDPGDFLVLHVDPDLKVDTIHFGKENIDWMQGVLFWVTGSGKTDKGKREEDWKVRKVE